MALSICSATASTAVRVDPQSDHLFCGVRSDFAARLLLSDAEATTEKNHCGIKCERSTRLLDGCYKGNLETNRPNVCTANSLHSFSRCLPRGGRGRRTLGTSLEPFAGTVQFLPEPSERKVSA